MKLKTVFSLLIAAVIIAGCNVTKEQAIDYAKETFEAGMIAESKEPNTETESFSYYLPSNFNVESETENNLILSDGNQLYLIFSNPEEDELSNVNYDQDNSIEFNTILNKTFITEDHFGYIIVSPFEKDDYKVIVGIGGNKVTTITELTSVKESVENIIDIINSITYR